MGSLITVESNEKFNDIIYSADKWVRDDNWAVHPILYTDFSDLIK